MTSDEIAPGIYDIPNEEYHSGPGISRSGLMYFKKKTPFHFWEKYINKSFKEESTAEKDFGNMFHSYLLEPKKFEEEYFITPKTRKGTKAYEELVKSANGKKLIDESAYNLLGNMAFSIHMHEVASKLVQNAQYEQSVFWRDNEFDVLCKCRPDILHSHVICDLKTSKDASLRAFQKDMSEYGYHLQAAMMHEAFLTIANKEIQRFVFVVVERTPPFIVMVYEIDEASLEQGKRDFKRLLKNYKECLTQNSWPLQEGGYQKISLPEYAFR